MRDADVTNAPLLFALTQGRQVGLPVQQIVDLHQVDAVGLQQPKRVFHLGDARFFAMGPDLGRQKCRGARLVDRQQLPGALLGAAVHGRAVDQRATGQKQLIEDLRQQFVFIAAWSNVETAIGADANHRQGFAAGRNSSSEHLSVSSLARNGRYWWRIHARQREIKCQCRGGSGCDGE